VRKVIVLNKSKIVKNEKIVELITIIKEMRRRQQMGLDTADIFMKQQPGSTLF
jgi:uncharacterized Fe-S cluster-containing MiaB family protein